MSAGNNESPHFEVDEAPSLWTVLAEKPIYQATPWIELSVQHIRLPDGRTLDNYHRIRLTDFAVVYAETADGTVLVEKQYKHGIGKVSLTLPAGMIEEGEDPLAGAQRELLEETGYVADNWRSLGSFVVNSNYGCGTAHLFAASNARPVATPCSGDLEEMTLGLMPVTEVVAAARRGEFSALSSMTALALATHPQWAFSLDDRN